MEREKYVNKIIKKEKFSELKIQYSIGMSFPFNTSSSQRIKDLDDLLSQNKLIRILDEKNNGFKLSNRGRFLSKRYELRDKEVENIKNL